MSDDKEHEYTQGICQDGAAILKDGESMTIEQILEDLKAAQAAQQGSAPIPQDADEARAMALIGWAWLRDNAPGQLTEMGLQGNMPEGFVLAERHFTPDYVVEAGKDCLRALEMAGCNDTRTIASAVFQDMLLAIERADSTAAPQPEVQQGSLPNLVIAGDRLCHELESWMATEHDRESQEAVAAWKRLRHGAAR